MSAKVLMNKEMYQIAQALLLIIKYNVRLLIVHHYFMMKIVKLLMQSTVIKVKMMMMDYLQLKLLE